MDVIEFVSVAAVGTLVAAGMIYPVIRKKRHEGKWAAQNAEMLGFAPLDADPILADDISNLYRIPGYRTRYELRNMFHRDIPGGQMFLFDLIDVSDENDAVIERQAVAIKSSRLNMPRVTLYPRVEHSAWQLAGRADAWMRLPFPVTRVDFPEFPTFASRYVVGTSEDSGDAHGFFEKPLITYLAQTDSLVIRAAGALFTLSDNSANSNGVNAETVAGRVRNALNTFRELQKGAQFDARLNRSEE
ncbi:MAG: hypothetical protein AB7Q01_08280 [Gammaproteobacteria bacterium]